MLLCCLGDYSLAACNLILDALLSYCAHRLAMANSVYTDVRVRITIDIRGAARDQECAVASLGFLLGRQSNNRDTEVTALQPNRFTLGALSTVKE